MKFTFSLLVFSFLVISLRAQKQTPAWKVVYNLYTIPDSTMPGNVRTEEMALEFDQNGAVYFSETNLIQEEKMRKLFDEASASGSKSIAVDYGHIKKVTRDELYQFRGGKQQHDFYVCKKFHNQQYLIAQPKPVIKWEISNQVMKIGDYQCQMAIGILEGQNYTVWFTTDFPLPYGPGKLYGLPGLILQARNASGTIQYKFEKLTQDKNAKPVSLPQYALTTNQKDFDRMTKAGKNVNSGSSPGTTIEVKKN